MEGQIGEGPPGVPDSGNLACAGIAAGTNGNGDPDTNTHTVRADEERVETHANIDNKPNVRTTQPTLAYAEYQLGVCHKNFTRAISTWRRHEGMFQTTLADSIDTSVLRGARDKLQDLMNEITHSYDRLKELGFGDVVDEVFEMVEHSHVNDLKAVNDKIREIESEIKSSKSTKSTSSKTTTRSSKSSTSRVSHLKYKATMEAAALQAKLHFIDAENQKRAEMEKLETMKNISIAQAKVQAIVKLENEDMGSVSGRSVCLPPDNTENRQKYVQDYVSSLVGTDKAVVDTAPYMPSDMHKHNTVENRALSSTAAEFVPRTSATAEGHIIWDTSGEKKLTVESSVKQTHSPMNHDVSQANVHAVGEVNRQISDLTKSFAEQFSISRLPIPEPGMFNGDPLLYPSWRSAFETLIEGRGIPANERIYYLKRYLQGAAKEAVEGYFMLSNSEAYEDAKALLQKRYGDPFVIANAFRNRLDSWPKIPPRSGIVLRQYSDFLRQCETAMQTNGSLSVLNDERENRKMLGKLPEWLTHRWGRVVSYWREDRQIFPPFSEFVKFIVKEANIACDPVISLLAQPVVPREINHASKYSAVRGKTAGKPVTLSTGAKESSDPQTDVKVSGTKPTVETCIYCEKRGHFLDDCYSFLKKPMAERKTFAINNRLCFGCMRAGHSAKLCRNRLTCKTCTRRHATALHGDFPDRQKEVKNEQSATNTVCPDSGHSGFSNDSNSSGDGKCSMIVPVWVSHESNPHFEKLVYALLDTQSDTTFVTDSTCHALGIEGPYVQLKLSTMTAQDELVDSHKLKGLVVRGYDSQINIPLPTAYSRQTMPANLGHVPTPEKAMRWPHLARIAGQLMPYSDIDVGLLVGYNCPRALAPQEVILPERPNEPYGERTELGWSIVGIVSPDCVDSRENDPIGVSHRVETREVSRELNLKGRDESLGTVHSGTVHFAIPTTIKETILPHDVARLMEIDFSEQITDQTISYNDRKFIQQLEEGIHKCGEHYEMPLPFRENNPRLPFRENNPRLPNNKGLALHRLHQLQKRFNKDATYKNDYTAFMNNVIQCGHAERVPESELQQDNGNTWYIPHHGVYHAKKPGKIRVVFDCSAKYQGVSLNDYLLKGPDLTNDLVGVLCRFRRERVAVTCDIEQMFHQFKVNVEHRNYLRFLWWNNDDCSGDVIEFRMSVHLFGAASSPGCANFGLKRVAQDHEADFGPDTRNFLQRDFYVDDGLRSFSSEKEAIDMVEKGKEMCKKGGLRLHKFLSNSKSVIEAIPIEDRALGIADLDLSNDVLPIERALGVQWCIELDTFQFRVKMMDRPLTRRGVLSTVSSIYDPLGFLAPLVLKGKFVLQQLCREGADWDDPLSAELQSQWELWRHELISLEPLNIQRCVKPANFGVVKSRELHHFSDGSTVGYGQCSYLRMVDEDQNVHCAFMMGKARVVPNRPVTVPRIELTAAVVSVKVSTFLKKELDFETITEVFWTDSQIVLGYLNNDARRFHVFVANRVQQIRDRTEPEQWRYVATEQNPADDGSRGLSAKDLEGSMWLRGPDFLWEREIPLASDVQVNNVIPSDDPEVKKIKSVRVQATRADEPQASLLQRLEYFSDWFHAKRAVTLCIGLKDLLLRSTQTSPCRSLSVENIEHAQQIIIKMVQAESFEKEIETLTSLGVREMISDRKTTTQRNSVMKKTSTLYRLDPFLDSDGLLRVGGRLKQANISPEVKYPVILPRKHHITELVIRDCHVKTQHQGRGMTVNEIRSSGYWVIGCSSAVSRLISNCVKCRRTRGPTQEQKMADLPADRVEPAAPFTHSGVDYFGPFYVKEGRKVLKRYGVIFTCMSCRAIHLETANSLDTDSFINALRRFISIRGPIRQLRSDRGTNFVGAERELREAMTELDEHRIGDFLLQRGCDMFDFKMNVPSSSHMGGVWERQIRSVRNVLASLMDHAGTQLDDESLRTLMCEVAAIVNSRPLTTDNLYDPTSLKPLTPNNLLTMKSGVILSPPGVFQRTDVFSRKRWRRVQYLANEFWKRWRKEFLQNLQSRTKWVLPRRDLSNGDVVMIKDDNEPRCQWRLGRVVETYPSEDGHVRKVKLAIGDSSLDEFGKRQNPVTYLERPIHKTVLLMEAEM